MPRGELTRLAHAYIRENNDALAAELRECPDNLSRARRFQQRLCAGEFAMAKATDDLAITRLRPFLTDPAAEIRKTTAILTREFARFYRKRNAIVHGGRTHADHLHPLAETMSPLIGAGIDRIVHVGLRYGVRPIALAAMAAANLDYLRPATAADPGNLLDLLEVRNHPS